MIGQLLPPDAWFFQNLFVLIVLLFVFSVGYINFCRLWHEVIHAFVGVAVGAERIGSGFKRGNRFPFNVIIQLDLSYNTTRIRAVVIALAPTVFAVVFFGWLLVMKSASPIEWILHVLTAFLVGFPSKDDIWVVIGQ